MAKQNSSSRLVRSDLRLMGLGLFSAALLLGVFGVFNVNLVGMAPSSDNIAERTIRVEEQPTDFGSLQNVEDSYAAEEHMMENGMMEEEMMEPEMTEEEMMQMREESADYSEPVYYE